LVQNLPGYRREFDPNQELKFRYSPPVNNPYHINPRNQHYNLKDPWYLKVANKFLKGKYLGGRPVLAQASQDFFTGIGQIGADYLFKKADKKQEDTGMVAYHRFRRRRFVKKNRFRRTRRFRRRRVIRRRFRRRHDTKTVARTCVSIGTKPIGFALLNTSGSCKHYPMSTGWLNRESFPEGYTHYRVLKVTYLTIPESSSGPPFDQAQDIDTFTTPIACYRQHVGADAPTTAQQLRDTGSVKLAAIHNRVHRWTYKPKWYTNLKVYPTNKVYHKVTSAGVNSVNGPVIAWSAYDMPTKDNKSQYAVKFVAKFLLRFYKFPKTVTKETVITGLKEVNGVYVY